MTKNGNGGSRFLLGGTNTVGTPPRFDADPSSLVDAVRCMMAVGYRPTITTGDGFGPIVRGSALWSVSVEWVADWAFHTPAEAERAAAAISAGGNDALVVLYDRVFNVVRLAGARPSAELASDLNADAFASGRFRCAHIAIDGRPPAVVAIALGGYPLVVASVGAISAASTPTSPGPAESLEASAPAN